MTTIPSTNMLAILGPTASGKTHLGVELARRFNGEIISADSRQVYRGMDIGSGKDLHEYGDIPHHLIDIVDPGYEFNVFEYQKKFCQVFTNVTFRQRLPVLVGGTGLYLDAVLSQYKLVEAPINPGLRESLTHESMTSLAHTLRALNPNLHNTTDLLDRHRLIRAIEIAEAEHQGSKKVIEQPQLNPFILGIRWDRPTLKQRIQQRLKARLEDGMVEEVEALHNHGVSWEILHFYGLEYRFVAAYLKGELNHNDMVQKLASAIYTFSKKQEKWFRRMEEKGVDIHWLDGHNDTISQAANILSEANICITNSTRAPDQVTDEGKPK